MECAETGKKGEWPFIVVEVGVPGCKEKSHDAKEEVDVRFTELDRCARRSCREVSGGRSSVRIE